MKPPSSPSATANRVVVALLDGRRLKGFVYNFNLAEPDLNVFPSPTADRKVPATLVELTACKAIFFVKTHEGSKESRDAEREAAGDPKRRPPRGRKIQIVFSDGEEMVACAESYSPQRKGFFVYPLDARSNNLRVFIVNANVRQVLTVKAEEKESHSHPDQERIARLAPGSSRPAEGVPLELKCEAVLRLLNGDPLEEIEADYAIPAPIISFWTRAFLQGGRGAISEDAVTGEASTDTLLAELRSRIRDLEKENERLRGGPAKGGRR